MAVATIRPFGLKAIVLVSGSPPAGVRGPPTGRSVTTSHSSAAFVFALARIWPSGLNASPPTARWGKCGLVRVVVPTSRAMSHNRIVPQCRCLTH